MDYKKVCRYVLHAKNSQTTFERSVKLLHLLLLLLLLLIVDVAVAVTVAVIVNC